MFCNYKHEIESRTIYKELIENTYKNREGADFEPVPPKKLQPHSSIGLL